MTPDNNIADHPVTQCPNCSTAFLVADDQLAIAQGKVRCGSCMHVFDATQYWLDPFQSNHSPEQTQVAEQPVTENVPPAADSFDDLEFSDSFLQLSAQDTEASSFEDYPPSAEEALADEDQWARELLEESEPGYRAAKNAQLSAILDQPGSQLQEADNERQLPEVSEDGSAIPPSDDNDPPPEGAERWITQLLGGDSTPAEETGTEETEDLTNANHGSGPEQHHQEEPTEEYIPEIFRNTEAAPEETTQQPPAVHTLHVMADRLKRYNAMVGAALRSAVWKGITAGAALLLIIQLGWHFREPVLQRAGQVPVLQRFCERTGCTLPAGSDPGAFALSDIIVARHPELEHQLILSARLANQAASRQYYPTLELILSDPEGHILASDRVGPEHYLSDDHRKVPARLPAAPGGALEALGETPIQLRIHNPAPDASRYEIHLSQSVPR